MQKKIAALLFLSWLMAASLAARQAAQTWVKYSPPSGKFTASFPAKPKADHQTNKDGDRTTEVYTYIAGQNGINFLVSYMELDPQATPTADGTFKTAQDNLLQMGGGKMLTSSRTQFVRGPNDKLPMLEFTGENATLNLKGLVIYDGYINYTLMTFCPKAQDGSAAITKFLSSFKLKPPAQQASDAWVKFTSAEGHFSALYPVQPAPVHNTNTTNGQTIQINNVIVVVKDMIIGVTFTDYDPNTTYPVESGMKAEEDNLLKGFNATLLTSTRAEFPRGSTEKLPSLEFTAASETQNLRSLVIVDNLRVYVVASVCPKTKEGAAASEKFFNSFKLTLKN